MKIYFACSITGGRQDEKIYQKLVRVMLDLMIEVPTAHIAETGIEEQDAREHPGDIFNRDTSWIEESDLMVAEVTTPSHGVGFEIGYALHLGKPVLCLHHQQANISKMITGNPNPLLEVSSYRDPPDAEDLLKSFIKNQGYQEDSGNK
jgi:nucleoside 2-deoxyribosyltransferase